MNLINVADLLFYVIELRENPNQGDVHLIKFLSVSLEVGVFNAFCLRL